MNAAEVEIGDAKRKRGVLVFPFLAERIRQVGEALAPLAKPSVLPFNVRGAN